MRLWLPFGGGIRTTEQNDDGSYCIKKGDGTAKMGRAEKTL